MKTITFDPMAGAHIEHACREASELSRRTRSLVLFTFNDSRLIASPKKSWFTIFWEWVTLNEMRRLSPESMARRRKNEEAYRVETVARQSAMDFLINKLNGFDVDIAGGSEEQLDLLMSWIKNYAHLADFTGVERHADTVLERLDFFGFTENALVGNPPEFFSTKIRLARYIAGQAINCLKRGMPPHPITDKFVAQYFALPL